MNVPVLVFSLTALLSGCASYRHSAPLHPPAGDPRSPPVISELRPEFRWQPQAKANVTYDLVVLRATALSRGPRSDCTPEASAAGASTAVVARQGEQRPWPFFERPVYLRERLPEARHRIDQELEPNIAYLWSVRVRDGDQVSGWACYDYRTLLHAESLSVERAGLGFRVSFPLGALLPKDADAFFSFRTAARPVPVANASQ
ncbi:MAG: hypothetical protein CAPSK01_000694 [Candidatus Accumulibacter vicinus]|uniref:Uncharacterized protein n=1 Tax=Candidatus Accumulibacter vicinus TaxID=2954382 RepID=A0A084Y4J1_9PROT|nr:MAG: hypothetical protein CAPSK01_000694 [Candidatus Accumulibacter vicinus]